MQFNWHNKKLRALVTQISLALGILLIGWFFASNAIDNLQRMGISSGFDFLWTEAGYDLYSPILEYTSESSHFDAYLVGLVNTLMITVFGILLATLLGFVMGVLRLSDNWIVSKTIYVIVEFLRNVPVLIWIIIWYFGVFLQLPTARNAINLFDSVFISNRGMYIPKPLFETLSWGIFIALIIGIVAKIHYSRKAKQLQDLTGKQSPVFKMSMAFIFGLPLVVYFVLGQPITWELPALKGFNFRGGMALKPEFVSLLMGLAVYTSASIAEIVRSGIVSVSKGQSEAAQSLNVSSRITMIKIIIPQALRVIIPPLNSQYLNLAKNSSLAIAIGYVDIVATTGGITLNQTGQAMECILIIMSTYLILSLLISGVMNRINKKVQIAER